MSERERRVLVIGLDGATWDVIDPLLARGALPALAGLVARGSRAHLRSTIPPVTAAAWPSLITGKNPGKHGLFGFRTTPLASPGEEREFVSSRSIAGTTWFDAFGAAGRSIVAYRVPLTYPVWPVNGVMVAGFPTPDLQPHTYPESVGSRLVAIRPEEQGLRSLEDLHLAAPDEVLRLGGLFLRAMETDLAVFLDERRHALVMFVVSLNDYFQHRFWALHDTQAPGYDAAAAARYGDVLERFYELQDAMIGRLLARLEPDDLVVLVSDHGGGAKGKRIFNPNAWLAGLGLLGAAGPQSGGTLSAALRLGRQAVQPLGLSRPLKYALRRVPAAGRYYGRARALADAVDWSRTRAYYTPLFYPAAGLHLNVRGRQPNGIVEPGAEYEALRERLLLALRELRDPRSGSGVVSEAYRREELFQGPHLEDAPDIAFVTDPQFQTWSRVDAAFVDAPPAGQYDWTGDHRMDGVLCLSGGGVFRPGVTLHAANVLDVAPTVLHAAGLPIPSDLDGCVLRAAFEPEFLRRRPVQMGEPLTRAAGLPREYSEVEEAGIRAALQGMGYIE